MTKKKLLFVCSGNTCRSPLAKVMAKDLFPRAGVTGWEVQSAGLAALSASPASEKACTVARESGLDLAEHCSVQLSLQHLEEADLVLVMTENHKNALLDAAPRFAQKVFTIKEYVGLAGDVDDPYGGDIESYRQVKEELRRLIGLLVKKIKE